MNREAHGFTLESRSIFTEVFGTSEVCSQVHVCVHILLDPFCARRESCCDLRRGASEQRQADCLCRELHLRCPAVCLCRLQLGSRDTSRSSLQQRVRTAGPRMPLPVLPVSFITRHLMFIQPADNLQEVLMVGRDMDACAACMPGTACTCTAIKRSLWRRQLFQIKILDVSRSRLHFCNRMLLLHICRI